MLTSRTTTTTSGGTSPRTSYFSRRYKDNKFDNITSKKKPTTTVVRTTATATTYTPRTNTTTTTAASRNLVGSITPLRTVRNIQKFKQFLSQNVEKHNGCLAAPRPPLRYCHYENPAAELINQFSANARQTGVWSTEDDVDFDDDTTTATMSDDYLKRNTVETARETRERLSDSRLFRTSYTPRTPKLSPSDSFAMLHIIYLLEKMFDVCVNNNNNNNNNNSMQYHALAYYLKDQFADKSVHHIDQFEFQSHLSSFLDIHHRQQQQQQSSFIALFDLVVHLTRSAESGMRVFSSDEHVHARAASGDKDALVIISPNARRQCRVSLLSDVLLLLYIVNLCKKNNSSSKKIESALLKVVFEVFHIASSSNNISLAFHSLELHSLRRFLQTRCHVSAWDSALCHEINHLLHFDGLIHPTDGLFWSDFVEEMKYEEDLDPETPRSRKRHAKCPVMKSAILAL
eukprot:PhM_4_TR565/c0_g1_i2/m.97151